MPQQKSNELEQQEERAGGTEGWPKPMDRLTRGQSSCLLRDKANCTNVRIVFKALSNNIMLERKINLGKCVCNFDFPCQNRPLQNNVHETVFALAAGCLETATEPSTQS